MYSIVDDFSPTITAKHFQLSYELLIELTYHYIDVRKKNISLPIVVQPKTDIMTFS